MTTSHHLFSYHPGPSHQHLSCGSLQQPPDLACFHSRSSSVSTRSQRNSDIVSQIKCLLCLKLFSDFCFTQSKARVLTMMYKPYLIWVPHPLSKLIYMTQPPAPTLSLSSFTPLSFFPGSFCSSTPVPLLFLKHTCFAPATGLFYLLLSFPGMYGYLHGLCLNTFRSSLKYNFKYELHYYPPPSHKCISLSFFLALFSL